MENKRKNSAGPKYQDLYSWFVFSTPITRIVQVSFEFHSKTKIGISSVCVYNLNTLDSAQPNLLLQQSSSSLHLSTHPSEYHTLFYLHTKPPPSIMSSTTTFHDYYEILGVRYGADSATITSSYRKLALATHPDRNKAPNATAEFQLVCTYLRNTQLLLYIFFLASRSKQTKYMLTER